MTTLRLTVNIRATKQRVWEIVTHPERYPAFVRDVQDVTVLQRSQSVALARWRIRHDGVEFQWTEQCHYDVEQARITFHAVRGDFASYDGSLALEHAGPGVALTLNATMDWGLPSFGKVIAPVVEQRVRRAFTMMLVAIKRYAERHRVARTYAFVIHPLDLELIRVAFREPNIAAPRKELLSKTFEWLPPFKCSDIVGLQSLDGHEVDGALIYCPLLPEQMVANGGAMALRKTIEAINVAESLGVHIVGLGAYAAQIGRKGVLAAEAVRVPVTTGTSYTVAMAIQGIETACRAVGVPLSRLKVGIVGATGGVGSTCAELLAPRAGALVLNARNQTRLDELTVTLKARAPSVEVLPTAELDWLVANADIIITATSTPGALLDARALRPGTIVCDVSRPRNVSPQSVEDAHGSVLVFDGGVVKPPGDVDFDFCFGLPPGLAYACMAETMILALSERYEGYSIGGNISAPKVEEIARLGDALGFRLAALRWCEREVPTETVEIVREHLRNRAAVVWV
ncbi:MAG: SRPBCC family protein [Candidatus Omnitrophica bacterium]|nr:SRPBCC family protein [Candidatus Omnitrophota bacterium]